ncbi:MAG: hypothetical protein SV487_06435, partial [Thermodesulfobacteriota bacterium]|nr:hypothetical protein [Thermodesulfobacteriota bacterium]
WVCGLGCRAQYVEIKRIFTPHPYPLPSRGEGNKLPRRKRRGIQPQEKNLTFLHDPQFFDKSLNHNKGLIDNFRTKFDSHIWKNTFF